MTARLDRVETWDDYREVLRELHASTGAPKYGTLSAGSGLAKSAISGLIGANPVQRPSESNSLRFVEACLAHAHRDPAEIGDAVVTWRGTWQRLRAADDGLSPSVAAAPTPAEPAEQPVAPPPRSRRSHRRTALVAAIGSAVAAVVAGTVWLAQPSPAAPPAPAPSLAAATPATGCTEAGADQRDVRLHRHWDSVYVCPTSRAMVYQWARVSGAPIGVLRSNPSWIVCWTHGETVAGSDVWYYTQGDDELGMDALDSWGFISAADVDVAQHPDPGIARRCAFPTRP
ncbi:hypothetical protein [Nocardioides ultimimeridianus]